ncbi:hypothetical protein M5689_003785 [Euphorbia peplus]|nr:hypothetical protein M5689_003785 [Euphorbia peplus]
MKAMWDGLKHDDTCTITFRANKTDFCLNEDEDIFINDEDITNLLSGDWLISPVIDVFIIALKHQYSKHLDTIGFMCSGSISSIACQRDKIAASIYMTNVMKQNESKRFIFFPYWEADHWILIVISLKKREVYTFDPFMLTINNRILIRPIIDGAFLAYVQTIA